MNFDEVASELYGMPPAQFTAARDRHVKSARAMGDRPLAERVRQLRKPTASAWLANLLVREQSALIDDLLELGALMRQAQEALAGPDLVALSHQRQQLVNALSRDARQRAAEAGHRLGSDAGLELEDTLRAALADLAAAELLRSGRLTAALHPASGGFVLTGKGVAESAPPRPIKAPGKPGRGQPAATVDVERERRARQRAAADDAVQQAEQVTAEAEQSLAESGEAVLRQQEDGEQLLRRGAELEAELNRVRAEESLCRRELRRLHTQHEAAGKRAQEAQRELSKARARREQLGNA